MKLGSQRGSSKRGSAMLEFAVGASVFVFLFTGTFQYGYSFYVYNNVVSAVRDGARFGALQQYPLGGPTVNSSPSSPFVTAIQNMTVYGTAAGGTLPVAPGLDISKVVVDVPFVSGAPGSVTVHITGFQINAVFGTWNLNGKPTSTFTYTGHWLPPA
jgi:hypothetical protein